MKRLAILCSLFPAIAASAQEPGTTKGPKPIQDNSFLIEEAYNQEAGVVQHISAFARMLGSTGWNYTFTQEWPVGGARHQLSFTLPIARVDETPRGRGGLGDVGLNYRYQLLGSGEDVVALAPRITILAPTGSSRRGLGAGGTGLQLNLPLSIVLHRALVVHSNAGATYTRRAHDPLGNESAATAYNLGQSVIWLAHPKFNVMLEGAWTQTDAVVGPGQAEQNTALLLAPGIRGAIDFPSGLQVVPGVAFPIGLGTSRGERNLFVYLSFEHAFTRTTP